MNKKMIFTVAASLLVIGSIAVKPAMAYFTDTHTGKGSVAMTMEMGDMKIVPDENVSVMTKKITVKNTGDVPVMARVKVFAGSTHDLIFSSEESLNWSENSDGYYYYNAKLEPTIHSSELVLTIDPKNETSGSFNVIVVEEATRVQPDGSYDWNEKVEYTAEAEVVINDDAEEETTDEGGAN
ncbi:hypothetical protein SAMN02910384_02020 [Pseudobutyrivibrio sp. ACV-2]|uniref:hypothetical protein n=1 Tax=Pseudobutyrivibrio sp. ACV-2 TaxID=1520801 RepID=UPI00089471F3|nr:hypothetical protein [Pseudobutyrivibrio sp. ACV-2]SEA65807.1 hypothetical protein SAMN02910384_02020 [Pseudobutyrivibrio sp. ACV-2]